MINGSVRQPRAWLSLDSGQVTLISCEVVVGRLAIAGEFTAVMALDDPSNPGAAFWASAAPIAASIVATNDVASGGTKTLISGSIIHVDVCFDQRTVTVIGQDMTEKLISARIDQNNQNQTISDVVSQVAGSEGFGLNIDSAGDMAGKTWDLQNYSYLTDVMSKWDVIQELARQAGKVAFVSGNTLNFVDPYSTSGGSYALSYTPPTPQTYATGNFMTLHCKRDIQFSEGVQALSDTHHTYKKESYGSESSGSSQGFQ
jgi:hypothetical protein